MNPSKYLNTFLQLTNRSTKAIVRVNPTIVPQRKQAEKVKISTYQYNNNDLLQNDFDNTQDCHQLINNNNANWINIDGINKTEIEELCKYFNIHPLIGEDIQCIGLRPKMEEIDNHLFCILNMLYYNENDFAIEQEQLSIIVGKNYLITIQEDEDRDVFNVVREKLKIQNSKIRQQGVDYLCYTLLDTIVDNYYRVMDKVGEQIEILEEEIIRNANEKTLKKIMTLRKEIILLKRNISPTRELIYGFVKSESDLLQDYSEKYFKDVLEHVTQAQELVENYRDVAMNLQDLYLNNVNLKMNEVMKVMTITTCLLALQLLLVAYLE